MEYTVEEGRRLIREAGIRLYEEHLVERTWGNISCRGEGNTFLITPSGRDYITMKEEDIPVVDLDTLDWKGLYKPSSEKVLHALVYRLRPEVSFIVHTHQYYGSIVSLGRETPAPVARYGLSSTKQLGENVAKAFIAHPESKTVLMPHHGVVFAASSPEEAFQLASQLEEKAKHIVMQRISLPQEGGSDLGRSRRTSDGFLFQGRRYSLEETSYPQAIHASIYRARPEIMAIGCEFSPQTRAVAELRRCIRPSIDDIAMIAGPSIRYARTDRIIEALKDRSAVYAGTCAICIERSEEDLDALISLIGKQSMAELYRRACKGHPVGRISALVEHKAYVDSYSKQNRG